MEYVPNIIEGEHISFPKAQAVAEAVDTITSALSCITQTNVTSNIDNMCSAGSALVEKIHR